MDKDLVNNQIVSMRKTIRNCKRFVKQKLNKQIKTLEQRLNKRAEPNPKLKNKIYNKRQELIAINGVNVDEVSKQALIENCKHFEDIIRSSQSSAEAKALARIASNESVTKAVTKFKDDNPNCEQWLPSQIELWQQKKALKRNKMRTKKGVKENAKVEVKDEIKDQIKDEVQAIPENNVKEPEAMLAPKRSNVSVKEKRIEKTKNEKKPKNAEIVDQSDEIISQLSKPKSDPFFLSKDSNSSEDECEDNSKEDTLSEDTRNSNKLQKKVKFTKSVGKSYRKPIQSKKLNFKSKDQTISKSMPKDKRLKPTANEERLHPSWAAKRSVKDKLKIDLTQKPMAKKIKFD